MHVLLALSVIAILTITNNIITNHNIISSSYYGIWPGTAELDHYYSINRLDKFLEYALTFESISETLMPGVDVWLGETGTMYSEEPPHYSDTYVNGFL